MLDSIREILFFWKGQKLNTDTLSCKLVYRGLMCYLLVSAAILQTSYFVGHQIQCFTADSGFQLVADNFCWNMGTFIYKEHPGSRSETNSEDNEYIYPGIPVPTFSKSKSDRIYIMTYQFMPVYFLVLSLSCYIGRLYWRKEEGGQLAFLIRDMKNATLDSEALERYLSFAVEHFQKNWSRYDVLFIRYYCVVVINLIAIFLQMICLGILAGDQFWTFGPTVFHYMTKPYQEWPYELAKLFPRKTKCEFMSIGPTGEHVLRDALCTLNSNHVALYLLAVYWWMVVIIFPFVLMGFVNCTLKMFSRKYRSWFLRKFLVLEEKSPEAQIIRNMSRGSTFIVEIMSKNLSHSLIADFLCGLDGLISLQASPS